MQAQGKFTTTIAFFLTALAPCLVALAPALGQCGGAVLSPAEKKSASGCGGTATLPAPPGDAPEAQRSAAGAVGKVDLPSYFASLGPDAALWYQHVQTLANPAFEGRAPGTRGAELAAEYIEFYFREYGLHAPFSGTSGDGSPTTADGKGSFRQRLTLGPAASAGCGMHAVKTIAQDQAESATISTDNVGGALHGKGRLKDEWIVIGGHYDAPGRPPQGSPCHAGGKLLVGADDNASGTAAVLILAKRLSEAYTTQGNDTDLRSILFVAFAAEETGLDGSRHLVENPPIPLDRIHAMLNLDMVGRMRQDTLWLSGVGTAGEFMDLLDPLLRESRLNVITEPGGTGSDQVSFWNVNVPALFVMTGGHDQLHTPADMAGTMNPAGASKVIDLAEKIAMRLAEHAGTLTFVAQGSATASGCCGRPPAKAGAQAAPAAGRAGGGGTAAASKDARPAPEGPCQLPDTIAGRRAAAFFEAFNSGSDDQWNDFARRNVAAPSLAARSMEERIAQTNEFRADWGTLAPLRVVSTTATELTVLTRASRTGEELTLAFQLEEQPPHGLVATRISGRMLIHAPASVAVPIDDRLREDTIKQIAEELREGYVYPEVGERLAEVLARNESEGRYGDVASAGDLAQRLTADLFAASKDRHLSVRPRAGPAFAAGCGSSGETGEDHRGNYGFRKTEVLPGNIGYIKFDMFHGSKAAQEVAAAALAFVAGSDALIFDLRENGGGSPEMIQFISSYLFDKPTHLNSFYDRLNNKTSETWTLATIPGKRFPSDLPVYVMTSGFTGSAAEEFTYNLKNLGRATIVGETTVGAAHPVTERVINDQFVLIVPYARAYNPITKKNWEGVGVISDIQVPASEALEAACKDAADKISARRRANAQSGARMRHLDAKRYVLQAIRENPIVCLGEGGHAAKTTHDFIKETLADPDIQRAIDVIIVEFATSRYQKILDDYVFGHEVPSTDLSKVWRNTAQPPPVPWDSPLYFELLKHIREINEALPEDNKIRVLGGEPAIRWEEVTGWADVNAYLELRDRVPAELAIEQAFQKGRKVLIIYGAAHLMKVCDGPSCEESRHPLVYHILSRYLGSVKVIEFLDTEALKIGGRATELEWGTAYETKNHWLGEINAELFFPEIYSRETGERKTLFKGLKVRDLVDALIYVGPSDQWVFVPPPLEAYDDQYRKELNRRSLILFGQSLDERRVDMEQSAEGALLCGQERPAEPCGRSLVPISGCGSPPIPDQWQTPEAAGSPCCAKEASPVAGAQE